MPANPISKHAAVFAVAVHWRFEVAASQAAYALIEIADMRLSLSAPDASALAHRRQVLKTRRQR